MCTTHNMKPLIISNLQVIFVQLQLRSSTSKRAKQPAAAAQQPRVRKTFFSLTQKVEKSPHIKKPRTPKSGANLRESRRNDTINSTSEGGVLTMLQYVSS